MKTSMKVTIWMVAISRVVCAMGATVLETIVKTIVTVANTVLDSRCMTTDRTRAHS